MKKLLLCLLLTLTLSACGQSAPAQGDSQTPEPGGQTQPADPANSVQTETTQDADRNLTAGELDRSETTDLIFFLEGQEEAVPAALFIGQGYSLYIPTEDWLAEQDTDDGVPVDSWENAYNDDVELRVLHLGERTLDECYAWFTQNEDDYVISEDKQGGLYGEDQEDRMVLNVRFCEGSGTMYAVAWEYPFEAAEGFGTRLSVIADTFEVMP